jgi:hypothetical protein
LAVSAVSIRPPRLWFNHLVVLLSGAREVSLYLVLAELQPELATIQAAAHILATATLLHTASLCIQDAARSSTMVRCAPQTEQAAVALEVRALTA